MKTKHPIFRHILLALTGISAILPASAQEGYQLITRSTLFAIGSTTQQDTYLSPLDYSGAQFSVLTESSRAAQLLRIPVRSQSRFQLDLTSTESPAGNADFVGGLLHFGHSWQLPLMGSVAAAPLTTATPSPAFRLLLGPQLGGTLGGLYHTRGGNNPAQAIAEIHVGAAASARYPFRLWRHAWAVEEQVDIPLLGLQFSPNYGQSYYELFSLGHTDHNLCVTTPFSAPSLRSQLTLDCRFGRTTLRLGYLMQLQQSDLNHLKRHLYTHAVLIGWQWHLMYL